MLKTWTLIAGPLALASITVPFEADDAWSKPKQTGSYLLCKCTCRATDSQGNHHYGSSNGVWYTTSGADCTTFPKCKVGQLQGIATDCLGTQKSLIKTPASKTGSGALGQ